MKEDLVSVDTVDEVGKLWWKCKKKKSREKVDERIIEEKKSIGESEKEGKKE